MTVSHNDISGAHSEVTILAHTLTSTHCDHIMSMLGAHGEITVRSNCWLGKPMLGLGSISSYNVR